MRAALSSVLLLAAAAAHASPLPRDDLYARQAATNSSAAPSSVSSAAPPSSSSSSSSSSATPASSSASTSSSAAVFYPTASPLPSGNYTTLNDTDLPAIKAGSQGFTAEHSVSGAGGAVTSEVDVCSNVGADLLAQGGSAADAIIGAALCVGVIDTFHSNIGGGGFMLVRSVPKGTNSSDPAGRINATYETIDFRESLPALGNETIYSNNSNSDASTIGGLAVGVPGELRGWETLHDRHGKLPWAKLFEQAIQIAEGGFRVPSQLGVEIQAYNETLCSIPYAREVYCPTGQAVKEGDIIKKPRYAQTLRTLQAQGADAFYKGEIAINTVAAAHASGGILSLDDLANYTAIVREANNITFANGSYNVFSTVAPSSGTVVLSSLATIDAINTTSPNSNVTLHRLIESTKFAYGERSELGDPAFVQNATTIQKLFVSPEDAARKAALINDTSVLPVAEYNPSSYLPATRESGTSELAAVDAEGNAVTLTTTVNLIWGSQVWTSDGILLNDEMDDFAVPGENSFGYSPSPANLPAAGKRPLSSISPTIAENATSGELFFAIGSAGGSKIITANIINGYNLLSSNGEIDVQQSLAQPRWHNQLSPATTQLEWAESDPAIPGWVGFSNQTAAFLTQVGHNITYVAPGGSTAQGIQRFDNGTLLGGAEVRQLSARAAALP